MTPEEFVLEKDSNDIGWSATFDGIVLALEEFAAANNKEALEIIEKGTRNRRYWKDWEVKLLKVLKGQTK